MPQENERPPASGSKTLWLGLAIFGTVFPNLFFMGHYIQFGCDLPGCWKLATINWISQGVTSDLLTASFLFWVWAGFELRRKGELRKLWLYVVLALGLGLSCAFPVFMYRHGRRD